MRQTSLVMFTVVVLLTVVGCKSSDRTLAIGEKRLTVGVPIQLARNSLPIASTRDGSKIALIKDFSSNDYSTSIVETDTLKELGKFTGAGQGAAIFSPDGLTLHMLGNDTIVSWDYVTGKTTTSAQPLLQEPRAGNADFTKGWNFDRSIWLTAPTSHADEKRGGLIVLNSGKIIEVAAGINGFDQFGDAWFQRNSQWIKVDRSGQETIESNAPGYLVPDQSHDRGGLHLTDVQTEVKYKGSTAYVCTVWLSHDKAGVDQTVTVGKRRKSIRTMQAALVFSGADLKAYGFLPGRDLVYVVTDAGSYLVPFTDDDAKKHDQVSPPVK